MKLLIRQRMLSWTDSYDIYDENMNKKYTAKADFLSFGHTIRFYDTGGFEVGCIREKLLRFFAEFEVYIGGRMIGSIKRKLSFLRPSYELDYNGWQVSGDIFEWDYEVRDSSMRGVASISKEIWHLTDTYVIDVFDAKDEISVLLLVAALDAERCDRN